MKKVIQCFCLRHLHLSDNLLEQLPAAALNTAPRLELLSLHGNPWTCDCQLNWLVEWSTTHEGKDVKVAEKSGEILRISGSLAAKMLRYVHKLVGSLAVLSRYSVS